MCQQLRFNFKILKRIVLEQSWVFLKFWDTTSVDLRKIADETNESTSHKSDGEDDTKEDFSSMTPFLKESFLDLADKKEVALDEL